MVFQQSIFVFLNILVPQNAFSRNRATPPSKPSTDFVMGSIGPTYETHEEFTPNLYPVFPESAKPCAELATFSLQKLEAGDIAEQARLFEVCQTTGFFLLNFDSTSRESLPEDAEAIGRLSETMFKNLTLEEKKAYPQFKKPYSLLGRCATARALRITDSP